MWDQVLDVSHTGDQFIRGLLRDSGPNGQLPDGTHYEYDADLRATVEVTPSGERFPVVLVEGKLQRDCGTLVGRKGEAA